jgi:hypothetical protein
MEDNILKCAISPLTFASDDGKEAVFLREREQTLLFG